jgi:hypothetical protein
LDFLLNNFVATSRAKMAAPVRAESAIVDAIQTATKNLAILERILSIAELCAPDSPFASRHAAQLIAIP